MNTTLTSYNYWPSVLEPHFFDNPYIEQDRAKIFYHADGYIVNPKPEPQIISQPEIDPNINFEQKPKNGKVKTRNMDQSDGKIRPYKCTQCNKSFLLKHHLTTHEKTHTGERPHVCTHCGKSFTHKYCLNTHLLLHSTERPFYCAECKKRFTLKHHLMSHKRVHRRETPFACTECGKSFPLKKQLITHEKFHKGERPFLCKECGDTFAQEVHLVMHLRFHGAVNSFACKDCGAAFMRKFELVNHEKIHGRQPLSCPICKKEFLQRRTMLSHVNAHTQKANPIPSICFQCGDSFPTAEQLSHHQKSSHSLISLDKPVNTNPPHTNVTPKTKGTGSKSSAAAKNRKFFCDICFRKFSAKHGLTQHKKRQHGSGSCDNVFMCNFCNKSFGQKDDLLLHQKQHVVPQGIGGVMVSSQN